jgi:hypothetical protein
MLFYVDNGGGSILLTKQNRYKNVILKVDLCEWLTADTPIYEAIVDWYNSSIRVFEDSNDSLNNVPCFEGSFKIPCDPRHAETYVSEAFQFLARGHSIHHPLCTCSLSLDNSSGSGRATELGLFASTANHHTSATQEHEYYFQPCQLETNGCRKQIEEIAKELGVENLNGIVKVSERVKMPLLEVLIKLAGMKFTEPGFLSSPLCCVPLEIQSAQDILAAAKAMYPKPYVLDCRNTASCETQSLIQDLQILKQRYLVRAVAGPHLNTFSVFYFNTENEKRLILQHMIDKYIQNLWHREARESCSFFNGPSQIEVERMLIEANIKPMQVQKQHANISSNSDNYNNGASKQRKRQKKNEPSNHSAHKIVGHLKHFRSSDTLQ